MRYNQDDLKLRNEFSQNIKTPDNAKLGSDESDKYEIDTNEALDLIYHNLLGEKQVNGVWIRDKNMVKLMNKEGASIIMINLNHLFNKNMQFGFWDEWEKRQIVADTMQGLNWILAYDYYKYDINPIHNFMIKNMIEKALREWLSISQDGNMIRYRAEKQKTIISKQETPQNSGGAY